ncbi:MAG: hypothetical protein LBB78_04870 [Spirochaetaceae bacterium]|jgi:hypothetical protein|nr:hypothetical protein [Spirochaetaceae bacterium]
MKKSIFWGSNPFQNQAGFEKNPGKSGGKTTFSKSAILKKSGFLLILLGFLFSCASPPPPETPAVPPQAPAVPPQAPAAPPRQESPDFKEARARAVSAMDKAKSVKADISVKTRYNTAFSAFTEAESLAAAGSAGGIGKYQEAETAFLAAHDEAIIKREEAQRQLSRAREAIKTVEDNAAEFDRQQAEDRRQGNP